MLAASQCVFAYARRMLLPRTYSPVSGRTALQHILQFFELLWIRLGRNDPCRQVRKRRAFAQLRRRCYCRELDASHCCFVCAWLIAYAQISVFRTAVDSVGTQFALPTDSQTLRFLLVVAAFAVYIQPVNCSFVSKLPTSIRRPVCAWLIAYAHISVFFPACGNFLY